MAENTKPGERIAKVMARAGLCSRREAEAWIAAGRVAINGTPTASPAVNVTARDRVTVDGVPLPRAERTRLFLFHKPRGLVTTNADPEGRPTIFGALPKDLPRLISVGRLDLSTEGLLLLTNDGGLARVLELPETGWLRRYRVRANGRVTQRELDALRVGVTIDGIRYGAIEAKLDRDQGANVWLTFAIREGKNREVRNVLEHLGLKVARLIRVSFGPFQLGELAPGAIEEIKTRHLREQLGERIAGQAGCDFTAPMATPSMPAKDVNMSAQKAAPIPPLQGEGGFARSAKPGGASFKGGSPTRSPSNSGLPEFGTLKRGSRKHATSVATTLNRKRGRDDAAPSRSEGHRRPHRDAGARGKGDASDSTRTTGADRRRSKDGRPSRQSDEASGKFAQRPRSPGRFPRSASPHGTGRDPGAASPLKDKSITPDFQKTPRLSSPASSGRPSNHRIRDQDGVPNRDTGSTGSPGRAGRRQSRDRPPRQSDDAVKKITQRTESKGKPFRKPERHHAAPDRAAKPRRPKTRYHGKRDS